MKSFISLLWQYESPQIQIPPTFLKNEGDEPYFYFYSERQKRVLRKKRREQNNSEYIVNILLEQMSLLKDENGAINKKHNNKCFNIRRQIAAKNLNLELVQLSQCLQILKSSKQAQIFIVKQHQCLVHFQCTIHQDKIINFELKDKFLRQQISQKSIKCLESWSVNFKHKIIESFCKKTINFLDQLKQKLKLDLQIIIVLSFNKQKCIQQILVAQIIKFVFYYKGQNISSFGLVSPQMQYKYTKLQKEQKIKISLDSHQIKQKSSQFYANLQSNQFAQQFTHFQSCSACNQTIQENNYKQVNVQIVRDIRKKIGLSIRGLKQEYYNICLKCYEQQI